MKLRDKVLELYDKTVAKVLEEVKDLQLGNKDEVKSLFSKYKWKDNISFDCWMIKIGYKFWFKAHDIAVFLDYKDPDQAICKKWDEFDPRLADGALLPPNCS